MNDLHLTLIQTDIFWEDKLKNLEYFEKIISDIRFNTDIILLPEMFTTGFSMKASDLAETENDYTVNWLKNIAQKHNTAIAGSLIIKENHNYFNRLYFVTPDNIYKYDKRHLFCLSEEPKIFTKGQKKLIIDYKNWKICPLICYDLRFPVWSRNNNEEYDILIYHANWPEIRINDWNILLKARAIENQCYVAGVNRIGIDGNNIKYSGNSCIINPFGQVIAFEKDNFEGIISFKISKSILTELRFNFPVLKDKDDFELK